MHHARRLSTVWILLPIILLLSITANIFPAYASSPVQVAPLPTATAEPDDPDCTPQALVRLPGVRAPDPRLNALAAASFAQARQEIIIQTGQDVLATLADVLRAPGFRSDRPGVADRSWHKAGRAIDLNLGGPFTLQRDGSMFRVFVGTVDITAIFEANGWQRIPVQGSVIEWWHYEYHPDGIAWQSAMAQVWPTSVLAAAYPEIDSVAVGCTTGSLPSGDGLDLPSGACVPDPPICDDAPGVTTVAAVDRRCCRRVKTAKWAHGCANSLAQTFSLFKW